jgi:hypothetical protein
VLYRRTKRRMREGGGHILSREGYTIEVYATNGKRVMTETQTYLNSNTP